MLTHSQIWAAIDTLAERRGLTPSSLAKRAGLDPTTFNKSKRQNSEGQLRWPSTESIAKVLAATGASVDDFLHAIPPGAAGRAPQPASQRLIPFRILDDVGHAWFDAQGAPVLANWDEIAFPGPADRNVFALGVRGDRGTPLYRDGDTVVIAPEAKPRHGDRVFVMDRACAMSLELLGHQTTTHIHSMGLDGSTAILRAIGEVRMLARIIWASQ